MFFGKKLAGVMAVIACLGLFGTGAAAGQFEKMQEGIVIGGVDVSGMTYEDARSAILGKVKELQDTKITVTVGEHEISTTAAELGVQWKNRAVIETALSYGNSGNIVTRYKQKKDLQQEKKDYDLILNANEQIVEGFVAEECKPFERERVESSIKADGSGGIDLTIGEDGLKLDAKASVEKIINYLENDLNGESGIIELPVEVDATTSKEDVETITDVLGTFTTYYGSTYGRNTNVERGAQLINGHLIKPGESFSVCDHLVPFNAENGYELGGAYESGRVVQEYGGGICQVSTTLYNALLQAEVQIDERHCHTMSVTYVPTSMDAAIAEGIFDLVFTNNYDTPIFISGYGADGELTFTVWGKDTRPKDREVYYESETTSTLEAPTNNVLVPAEDQPVGYFSQVQSAMAGSTAVLYKYVTYQGETTCEIVNESTYEATPNTYEVGTIGATDTLLNAIYNDDIATAQLIATGSITIGTGTGTTLQPVLDPIRNIYVDPMTGQPIDNSAWGSAGTTDGTTGYTYDTSGDLTYDSTDGVYYDNSTVYY